MHRIDTANAVTNLFGAGKNGFGSGNPATNTQATFMNDEWCNTIQEELAAIPEAAGISLNKTQRNQVLMAMQAMFGGVRLGRSYVQSDWCWLDKTGGLILQWGSAVNPTAGPVTVTFPTSFNEICFGAMAILMDNLTASQSLHTHLVSKSLGNAIFGRTFANNGGIVGNAVQPIFWFSVGK